MAYLEALPMVIHQLSNDFKDLRNGFRSYSTVYSDERLAASLIFLSEDLKHEADCAGRFIASRSPLLRNLQVRLHLVLLHYTYRLRTVERLLADFLSEGLAIITTFQQEQERHYLTMSTIATFLSGVTATMLQMSYQTNDRLVDVGANLLFLASLVFSTTSAVSGLVSIAWFKSVIPTSESSWARECLEKWPRASLILSGICYASATCGFVFSTGQRRATQVTIVALAAVCVILISCSFAWLVIEEAKILPICDGRGMSLTKRSMAVSIVSAIVRSARFCFGVDYQHEYAIDTDFGDEKEDHFGHPGVEGRPKPFEMQLGMDPIPAPSFAGPATAKPPTAEFGLSPAMVPQAAGAIVVESRPYSRPAEHPHFPGVDAFLQSRNSRRLEAGRAGKVSDFQ